MKYYSHISILILTLLCILNGTNEDVLYHETEDYLEQLNLINENPVQAKQMRRLMADWMNQTGDRHVQPWLSLQ